MCELPFTVLLTLRFVLWINDTRSDVAIFMYVFCDMGD